MEYLTIKTYSDVLTYWVNEIMNFPFVPDGKIHGFSCPTIKVHKGRLWPLLELPWQLDHSICFYGQIDKILSQNFHRRNSVELQASADLIYLQMGLG